MVPEVVPLCRSSKLFHTLGGPFVGRLLAGGDDAPVALPLVVSTALLVEMEGYAASCMPAVNQLELHPRSMPDPALPDPRTLAQGSELRMHNLLWDFPAAV